MLSLLSTLEEGSEDDDDEDLPKFMISPFMESLIQAFKLAVINVEIVFKQVQFKQKVLASSKHSIYLELMHPFHSEVEGYFHEDFRVEMLRNLMAAAKVGEIPLEKMYVSHLLKNEKVGFQPRKAKLRSMELISELKRLVEADDCVFFTMEQRLLLVQITDEKVGAFLFACSLFLVFHECFPPKDTPVWSCSGWKVDYEDDGLNLLVTLTTLNGVPKSENMMLYIVFNVHMGFLHETKYKGDFFLGNARLTLPAFLKPSEKERKAKLSGEDGILNSDVGKEEEIFKESMDGKEPPGNNNMKHCPTDNAKVAVNKRSKIPRHLKVF